MGRIACQFKPLYEVLVEFLRKEGFFKKDLPKCRKKLDSSCPCSGLIKTIFILYEQQPSENSAELIELLEDVFANTYLLDKSYHPKLFAKNSYLCPELNITMYQPCGIESCIFHSKNKKWCNNCILHYITKQSDPKQAAKRTTLSYNELAILVGVPTIELRKYLNSALSKLRQSTLKSYIEEENIEGRQYRILTSSVCPVCERDIDVDTKKIIKKGIVYCSETCLAFKPPQILKIEQEFKLPINKVLSCCLTNFSSINIMCTSLGLSQEVVTKLCSTYNLPTPPS